MAEHSLLQDFIVETGEHLAQTERNLLFLEQQPNDAQVLNEIFRSIHTIKGSSEYLGLERIAELSHKLENLLDLLRRGGRGLDGGVMDVLIGTNDRIAQLVDDLAQHEQERTPIEDLVELIEKCCGLSKPVTAEEGADEGSVPDDTDEIQEEYDEELFGIFLDQLRSGLEAICEETRRLQSGEDAGKVLVRYGDRLGTLRSSANYMGYEKLKQIYDHWSQAAAVFAERCAGNEPIDPKSFAQEVTEHNLERVKQLFPKVDFLKQVTLQGDMIQPAETADAQELRFDDIGIELAADEQVSNSPESALLSDPVSSEPDSSGKAGHSLLHDFIIETGEHLAVTERNLLLLEQQPQDGQVLNEIFRSIHTIKGSSEYLGLERIAELSHKLENLLDLLRRGERGFDGGVIDLLIGTNDRIAQLLDDLAHHQQEKATVDDLVAVIENYCRPSKSLAPAEMDADESLQEETDEVQEEYDEELYGIFLDQLRSGLEEICADTRRLQSDEEAGKVLARYEDRLGTLLSSANYMGYDKLKQVYLEWSRQVTEYAGRWADGESVDRQAFAREVTERNLERVKKHFPKVDFLKQVMLQACETELAMGKAAVESAPVPAPAGEAPASAPAELSDQNALDPELLADFMAESGEQLDEIIANLQQLTPDGESSGLLNDLFRAVHTMRGSADYIGLSRIALLMHRLEKLLDQLRLGELATDRAVIDLLIAAKDRTLQLVEDLVQHQAERTSVDDLVACIEQHCSGKPVPAEVETPVPQAAEMPQLSQTRYEETYDQELFAIFNRQLLQGLTELQQETAGIRSGNDAAAGIESCLKNLGRLRSSANYMEYFELKEWYESWMAELETLRTRVAEGSSIDWISWADIKVPAYINQVRSFFITSEPTCAAAEFPAEPAAVDVMPAQAPAQEAIAADALQEAGEEVPIQTEFPDVQSDEERSLLEQLEKAFDAKINSIAGTGNGETFQAEMVRELLSNEENDAAPIKAGLFSGAQGPNQDNAAGDLRGSVLESLLFTDYDGRTSPRKTLAPRPLAELIENQEPSTLSLDDGEERRGQLSMGRRGTDKFRERMVKQSIRVDAAKIDALMNQVGELVVTRAGFNQLFFDMREFQLLVKQSPKIDGKVDQTIKELTNRINAATVSLARITSELQDNVMKVRMLPIAQLFSRFPRVVHDLVRNTTKQVELDIRGEETELDRMVIEQISDPLMHIIRNAVDHGLETVAERQRKGKPEAGTLRLEAYHEGNSVVLEIHDDGRGIDVEKIKVRAAEKGYATSAELEAMNRDEIIAFIMRPGFSTADEVTHTSGRGVGMDVVKDHIEKLNGTITIDSSAERGALFRIKIPLTLAIIQALMVGVSGEIFTIPLSAVDETLRIRSNEISSIEGMEVYYLREHALPLIRLDRIFKMAPAKQEQEIFVVVVNTGNRQVGLVVDQLKGREEVVIKPLEDYLQEKSGFSGATILGDGSISLILDVGDIVHLAVNQHIRKVKVAAL
jgi:two-component system, chemotaxis family, sensor kinase CheA